MKTKLIGILAILILIIGSLLIIKMYIDNKQGENNKLNIYTNSISSESIEMPELNNENIDASNFDFSTETTIRLADDATSVEGSNVKIDGNTIIIVGAGAYRLTGNLTDGRIIVYAPKENVKLILDEVNINCSYSSPIYVFKSGATMIYVEDGTSTNLIDGATYLYNDEFSTEEDEEPDATLYSKSDLIICGSGTLNVKANYKNAITSKDTLLIKDTIINIDANNNGINGKDSNTIENATLNITCVKNAIRSSNDTDETLGWIKIIDSNISINSQNDGINAETYVLIDGGKIDINAADDGIHAGKLLTIDDGKIIIENSNEGIEANNVVINGGDIEINSSDDGINVNGGNNGMTQMNNRNIGRAFDNVPPEKMDKEEIPNVEPNSNPTGKLVINGGTIVVNSNGDGLDSNGSIEMNGGYVIVQGPTNNGNGAIDYDSSFVINEGTIVAIGSSGMAQGVTSEKQASINVSIQEIQKAGSKIEVKDEDGNTIIELSSEKQFSNIVVSSSDIVEGKTYSIYVNGDLLKTETASLNTKGSGFGNFGAMKRK